MGEAVQIVSTIVFFGFILGSLCDVIATVLHSGARGAIWTEAARTEIRNESEQTGLVGTDFRHMDPAMRRWMQ
jgi:hypothetical protein